MIEVMSESIGSMLAVKASKKLSEDDYTKIWIPALQEKIEKYGKISCLLYMDENFEGWEIKAMWEDKKFGLAHKNDFEKLAIVGGPSWVAWGAKIASMLMKCEVKSYDPKDLTEAVQWVTPQE